MSKNSIWGNNISPIFRSCTWALSHSLCSFLSLSLSLSLSLPPPPSHLQILDKLLDRESQTHKPQTLSSFYSSKPAAGSQRSPSKHTASGHSGVGGATGGVSKHAPSSSSATTLAASSSSSTSAVTLAGEEVPHQAELNPVPSSAAGESTAETREHGENPHDPHFWCHNL